MKLESSFKLAIVLLTSFAVVQASHVKRSLAQTPTDIDRLFDDEEDDLAPGQPNARNPVPPPPPPAPAPTFDNPNAGVSSGANQSGAGFPSENLRGGGGSAPTFGANGKAPAKTNAKAAPPTKPASKKAFKDAQIEDITNENYPDEIESFDYPNAEITDVIKAISDLTGKNFIIDSTVHGKISIVAPSKVTVAEAYKAFLAALAANGFTVVPYGKFLKIKNSKASRNDSISFTS